MHRETANLKRPTRLPADEAAPAAIKKPVAGLSLF